MITTNEQGLVIDWTPPDPEPEQNHPVFRRDGKWVVSKSLLRQDDLMFSSKYYDSLICIGFDDHFNTVTKSDAAAFSHSPIRLYDTWTTSRANEKMAWIIGEASDRIKALLPDEFDKKTDLLYLI